MPQKTFTATVVLRWMMGITMAVLIVAIPWLYHRHLYSRIKRLRVVEVGKFYRSGRATAAGLEQTIKRYQIKTVINLMNEEPEPELALGFFDPRTISQREVCERNGAKMIYLPVDLVSRYKVGEKHPKAIDEFLKIMDDPKNHPVLLHCRAGLHRTGCLSAVYRMEYNEWSPELAWRELRAHGFGEHNCYGDNDYIVQYIAQYVPRNERNKTLVAQRKSRASQQPTLPADVKGSSSGVPASASKSSGRPKPDQASSTPGMDWTTFYKTHPEFFSPIPRKALPTQKFSDEPPISKTNR